MNKEEILYNQLYERTKDFGRTQFVREIQMQINANKMQINANKKLEKENKQLKERIDKATEYISTKKAIINTDVIRIFDLFEIDEQGYTDELLEILKGESNE